MYPFYLQIGSVWTGIGATSTSPSACSIFNFSGTPAPSKDSTVDVNDVASHIEQLTIASNPAQLHVANNAVDLLSDSSVPEYPPLLLNVYETDITRRANPAKVNSQPTNDNDEEDWAVESYEKASWRVSKTFRRFHEYVSQNANECVRYSFASDLLVSPWSIFYWSLFSPRYQLGGQPILYSTDHVDDVIKSTCPQCGGKRHFEVQLMPAIVAQLPAHGLIGGAAVNTSTSPRKCCIAMPWRLFDC